MSYPVQVSIRSPQRYDRVQLVLRLVLAILLGWVGLTAGALVFVLYLALPAIAAIAISTHATEWFESQASTRLWRALSWLFAFSAYMLLLTDRFPVELDGDVKVAMRMTSRPTLHSALLRLLSSLPSAFVLALLGIVSCFLSFISIITVLIDRTVPSGILAFQEGFLRWQARLAAYHGSLVDEYPPFSFEHDTEPVSADHALGR